MRIRRRLLLLAHESALLLLDLVLILRDVLALLGDEEREQ